MTENITLMEVNMNLIVTLIRDFFIVNNNNYKNNNNSNQKKSPVHYCTIDRRIITLDMGS